MILFWIASIAQNSISSMSICRVTHELESVIMNVGMRDRERIMRRSVKGQLTYIEELG